MNEKILALVEELEIEQHSIHEDVETFLEMIKTSKESIKQIEKKKKTLLALLEEE